MNESWREWRRRAPAGQPRQLDMSKQALRLPLFKDFTRGLSTETESFARDAQCTSCELGVAGKSCMPGVDRLGDGPPLLVIYGSPTKDEQSRSQPFTGATAYYLRQQVEKIAGGRAVRYSYAVACPEGRELEDGHVDACRPYVNEDVNQLKPSRIIAVGFAAVKSVFGLYIDTTYTRRAWAMVNGIPAFSVLEPAAALRNRFLRRQFERDLEWAVKSPDPQPIVGETRVLSTGREVAEFLGALRKDLPTAIDVEHDGDIWSEKFTLLCVGVGQDPAAPAVIPAHVLEEDEAREAFEPWLGDPSWPKTNQNIKHDRHALYRAFGVDMAGISHDTMLRAQMREPEAPAGLGKLAWQVGFGGYKEASNDAADEDAKGGKKFAAMPADELHAYNGRDIAVTLLIDQMQSRNMGRLGATWERLVGPAFEALAVVERNGILLSEANVRAYDTHLQARFQKIDLAIKAFPEVPAGFNPGSSPQKAALLFDVLGLTSKVKTKSGNGRSTAAAALADLRTAHPLVPLLLEWGGLKKQISTYGLNMLEHISPVDGRVHTTFKLVRTDRLSSSQPNMQNITRPDEDGDEGSWARGCFVAGPGNKLVSIDFSQLELRVACMLSGDDKMAKAFESGYDFHRMTAAAAFNVPPDKVTDAQRSAGKTLNFAIVFGESEWGIAKKIGCGVNEAEKLLASLLTKYGKLGAWLKQQVADAEVKGELWAGWDPPGSRLQWAKRRSLHGIGEAGMGKEAEGKRKHWKNVAMNTPIQWLANSFALASIVEAVRWTTEERPEAKVIMAVHDEILFECPDHLVEEVARTGKRIMLSWPSGVVRLKVSVETGRDWGHMETYECE